MTESSDTDGLVSPHVKSARTEQNTPHTPKTRPGGEDRHFFGNNFKLECLAEAASLQKSTLSEYLGKRGGISV